MVTSASHAQKTAILASPKITVMSALKASILTVRVTAPALRTSGTTMDIVRISQTVPRLNTGKAKLATHATPAAVLAITTMLIAMPALMIMLMLMVLFVFAPPPCSVMVPTARTLLNVRMVSIVTPLITFAMIAQRTARLVMITLVFAINAKTAMTRALQPETAIYLVKIALTTDLLMNQLVASHGGPKTDLSSHTLMTLTMLTGEIGVLSTLFVIRAHAVPAGPSCQLQMLRLTTLSTMVPSIVSLNSTWFLAIPTILVAKVAGQLMPTDSGKMSVPLILMNILTPTMRLLAIRMTLRTESSTLPATLTSRATTWRPSRPPLENILRVSRLVLATSSTTTSLVSMKVSALRVSTTVWSLSAMVMIWMNHSGTPSSETHGAITGEKTAMSVLLWETRLLVATA